MKLIYAYCTIKCTTHDLITTFRKLPSFYPQAIFKLKASAYYFNKFIILTQIALEVHSMALLDLKTEEERNNQARQWIAILEKLEVLIS